MSLFERLGVTQCTGSGSVWNWFETVDEPQDKPMAVMSPTERKLMALIITEREERTRDVEELRKLIDEASLGSPMSRRSSRKSSSLRIPSKRVVLEVAPEITRPGLESPGAAPDGAAPGGQADHTALIQFMDALTASLNKIQEDIWKTSSLPIAMQSFVSPIADELKALTAEINNIEYNLEQPPVEGLKSQVGDMDSALHKQAEELAGFRQVLMQLCANVPLQAIRATKSALKCSEMSREEREKTLDSLEAKEKQLLSEVGEVGEPSKGHAMLQELHTEGGKELPPPVAPTMEHLDVEPTGGLASRRSTHDSSAGGP